MAPRHRTDTALLEQLTAEDILAEYARRNLRAFVEQAWPHIEPDVFVPNWHIDVICEHLEAVTRGEIKKLLMNVPPGTMKSKLVSVFWPAWEWATDPTRRYLSASYGETLAIRDAISARDLVSSAWYQRHWSVTFRTDQNAKLRYDTTAGGWRISTSVGGRGTGEHPHRIIIDDPHNAKQAESDAERQAALDWFDRTLSTRGMSTSIDARMVVIMQRLHQLDLSGHILEKENADEWVHLCLPMRYEPKAMLMPTKAQRPDVDARTTPGELLWPVMFPEARVRSKETELGSYGAAGQFQQRPVPAGGGMFQREHFAIVDSVPEGLDYCRFWDCAATDGAGDYTSGVKIGRAKDGRFYVVDVIRDRKSAHVVDGLIQMKAYQDGTRCQIREEQEPGSSGKAVIAARTRALAGYDYRGIPATGEKSTRWRPFAVQVEAGNVSLVRATWNSAFVEECCAAPFGAHDDQIDAAAGAFNSLAFATKSVVATISPRGDQSWQRQYFR